ncbi:hypothetical protein SD71_01340 [Cohnella kolymensis]|uniref:Winged helix-turn-helix domain-containing protein n=1 Tax=Cohnella kolymensis TaxID=1590652 RepID=A0ABR5A8H7_9BACL|nr:crosslink repair DNA glycosylase YcaQ family protein [Cohnella kolymensis]KIL37350.1 hypothetical protein SD71_01340 [Cohnella kolymensis]
MTVKAGPVKTTKRALRRFLLETQMLLHPPEESPSSDEAMHRHVMDMIRKLECVQIDPVNAVRPNQHLTLAARIPGYRAETLNELLRGNEIFEYLANAACIIPMQDYAIFEPTRRRFRQHVQSGIDELGEIVGQVLEKLASEGPLPSKAFESDQKVHGYWDNVNAKTKATSHALNLLTDGAQIRIVGRQGNQRLFDLVERTVPAELLALADQISTADALEAMLHKYFRAYRVFEPSDARFGWQRLGAGERREAIDRHMKSGHVAQVEVEGLTKPYYILASDVGLLEGQTDADEIEPGQPVRFLPPLDNLLWSRKRLEDLFDFEYRWEIYTPAVKRKYGYYAMPILAGDRLIGRMDPRLDTKRSHLTVQLLQIEPEIQLTDGLHESVQTALESFARTHGAETVSIEKSTVI